MTSTVIVGLIVGALFYFAFEVGRYVGRMQAATDHLNTMIQFRKVMEEESEEDWNKRQW